MKIRTLKVRPSLPDRLKPLIDIAHNIYWTWTPEAGQLFMRIDLDLWESTNHNPIRMLGEVSQERMEELSRDESFVAHMDTAFSELKEYMNSSTWFSQNWADHKHFAICYFSAEFGLHESLPVYSGGLGLLAGDHLKSASDLGLPLSAIGLLYRQGYFRQYLNAEGWQQENYPENDYANLPILPVFDEKGEPLVVGVSFPGREVFVRVWQLNVGRIKLYLLDTNLSRNSQEDRGITAQLYGGDSEMRIKQEMILGIGGMIALRAMNIIPSVCHMNEGHSAFLALERIRYFMQTHQLGFAEAAEIVSSSNVFTTHTPVPAGNDVFAPDLLDAYFKHYYPSLGINREQFLGLGRSNPFDRQEPFCMTVLAIRLAAHRNGVSALHGEVSRKMWKSIWPGLPENEIPIDHVTNGVHAPGWVSAEMVQLYTRYLGPRWRFGSEDVKTWKGIDRCPDSELWRTHERRRERLVALARKRLVQQLTARGAQSSEIERAREVLDPEALTIGFARRFATYKRGALLFRDADRLDMLLNDHERPVQILFAGKAHPRDNYGKEVIKQIVHFSRQPRFRNRVVFIEDYDISLAHYLAQGVDVWVNNPRRPLEASGTSGMKVSMNGGLNLSILDGWWVEGYTGDNGWAIGNGEEYEDQSLQDEIESRALYDLLEKEVIPTFYKRGSDDLPREWIAMMKRSIKSICPVFNTNRMVIDYWTKFYQPAAVMREKLKAENFAASHELAGWKNAIRRRWVQLDIVSVEAMAGDEVEVGKTLPVTVKIQLGEIKPEEVQVEIYHGRLDSMGQIVSGAAVPLENTGMEGGVHLFSGQITFSQSGRYGYGVRILPKHPLMIQRFEPGLILWG